MRSSPALASVFIATVVSLAIWKIAKAPPDPRGVPHKTLAADGSHPSPTASMSASRVRSEPDPAPMPEPVVNPRPRSADSIESLPRGEQDSLQQALREARHTVRPLDANLAALPQNQGVSHFASNPGQDLTARFLASGGVRIESGQPGRHWQATLQLKHGSGKAWQGDSARVQLEHENLSEWYVNKAEGIEHGFTLNKRDPSVSEGEPRVIDITLGELRAKQDPARDGDLVFSDPMTGEHLLGYRHLKVWDDEGTPLAATMRPRGDGIQILIDDRIAKYPVTIDPLIVSMEQRIDSAKPDPGRSGSINGSVAMYSNDSVVVGVAADKAAYVFKRTNSTWIFAARLAAAGIGDTRFGAAVAIGSGGVIVGAPGDDYGFGAAYVFAPSGSSWSLQRKLLATDGTSGDEFGSIVKTHGSTFVVATKVAERVAFEDDNGYVYVFVNTNGVWTQQAKIVDPIGATLRRGFGAAIAVSGNFIAVGAPDSFVAPSFAGQVLVFVRSEGRWSLYNTLEGGASGTILAKAFGRSLNMSGNMMIVGDLDGFELGPHHTTRGHAYIFTHGTGGWVREAVLAPPTSRTDLYFGRSVAIFEETIFNLATAVVTDKPIQGTKQAHIYVRSGSTWQHQASIDGDFSAGPAVNINTLVLGPDARVYARNSNVWSLQQNLAVARPENDHFGLAVDIEGNQAIVGALDEDTPAGASAGAAYLFQRSGTTWTRSNQLLDSTGLAGDRFGVSVGITADYAIVGADYDDENSVANCGSATLFARNTFWGTWAQLGQKCKLETTANATMGRAVAINGSQAIIGSPNWNGSAGRVWVLSLTSLSWSSQGWLQPAADPNWGVGNSLFGFSVAIHGDVALVGQPRFSPYFPDVGRAHVFRKSGGWWTFDKIFDPPAIGAFPLPERGGQFGFSVALDGNTAVVGANGGVAGWTGGFASDNREGRAFASTYSGGSWSDLQTLPATGVVSGSHFGMSSAVSGNTIAIGAFGNETMPGKVHLFTRSGTSWIANGQVVSPITEIDNAFGASTSLSGDTLLVGGYGIDTASGTDAGAAYVFRIANPDVNAPVLTLTRSGSNAILSWTATPGWILQRSPSLETGSWQTLTVTTDGTHTHPLVTGEPRMFFRLTQP